MNFNSLLNKHKALLLALPISLLSAQSIAAAINDHIAITGTYFGSYQLSMNVMYKEGPDDPGFPFQLGSSTQTSYWQWDFDNNLIVWGGGRHSTIMDATPSFQPYNSDQILKANKIDEVEVQIADIEEITIPFIDHEDGTYSVDYGHKIHLVLGGGFVNKPIGSAQITFQVNKSEMGELVIKTLDREIEGPDGVPGTVITNVFPLPVQPQFDSLKMWLDDQTDSNNDGISDIVASVLKLDINATDSDLDTYSDINEIGIFVRPTDSDKDGLADVYEPAEAANADNIIGQLALLSNEKVTLSIAQDEHFSFAHAQTNPAHLTVNKTNDAGEPLFYGMGLISFHMTNYYGDSSAQLAFSQPIPAGLQLFQLTYTPTDEVEGEIQRQVIAVSSAPLNWQQERENVVSFNFELRQSHASTIPEEGTFDPTHHAGTKVGLMLVHSEENRLAKPVIEMPVVEVPVLKDPVTEAVTMVNSPVVDTSTSSKSGGSMNGFFITCLGLFAFGRKKLTAAKVSR